jgi:hypothetical protein
MRRAFQLIAAKLDLNMRRFGRNCDDVRTRRGMCVADVLRIVVARPCRQLAGAIDNQSTAVFRRGEQQHSLPKSTPARLRRSRAVIFHVDCGVCAPYGEGSLSSALLPRKWRAAKMDILVRPIAAPSSSRRRTETLQGEVPSLAWNTCRRHGPSVNDPLCDKV